MILSKLKLDEENEIEFSMQVFGTHEPASDVRLVIYGESYDVVVHGDAADEKVKFIIPKMKNILESGIHGVKMEVIIDGKIFSPLDESASFEFEPLVELDVSRSTAKPVMEEVKVTPVSVTSKSPVSNKIDEAMEAGYDIEEYGSIKVMKKGSRYEGIVSETKMVKSEFAFSSVEELVEHLTKK